MGACNHILRSIEILLVGACAGLHYYSLEWFEKVTLLLVTATVGGYVIVLIGAFLAALVGAPLPKRAWIIYCLGGIGLFTAVGVLSIQYQTESRVQGTLNKVEDWVSQQFSNDNQVLRESTKNYGLAKGATAIALALTFFIDTICTFRSGPTNV